MAAVGKSGLTIKQEKFCRKLIDEDMTATAAYAAAGYGPGSKESSHAAEASKLLKNHRIIARIEALQDEAVYISAASRASLANEYDIVWQAAFKDGQFAVCSTTTTAKAKLLGFISDKPAPTNVDLTIINRPLPYPTKQHEMTLAEWEAQWSPREIDHKPNGNGHG